MTRSELDKALDVAFAAINSNPPFFEIESSKRKRLYHAYKKSLNKQRLNRKDGTNTQPA